MLAGYLYIGTAAILFGVAGAVSKYVFIHHMGPLDLTILRNVVSCLMFIAIFGAFNLKTRFRAKHVQYYILVGVLMTGVNYSFFLAISMNGVAVALVLQYTAPVFVIIFESGLGLSRLTKPRIITVVIAFIGCFFLVKGYEADFAKGNVLGVIVGITSGMVFGLYNMAVNLSHKRGLDGRALVLSSFVVSAIIMSAFVPQMTVGIADINGERWLLIVFISAFATVLPYWLFVTGLKVVPPFQATIVSILDPLAAAIVAAILLGETLEPLQVLGIIIVLSAVVCAPLNAAPVIPRSPEGVHLE